MSKVLYVLRHAQSVGKQSGQRDFERVLSVEGIAQSRALGREMTSRNIRPDLVLSSSAVRARQTLRYVNESLSLAEASILFKEELYEALMVQCLDLIGEVPAQIQSILLIGHNPWLSMLASTLSSANIDMAPCQLLGLEFDSSAWSGLQHGRQFLNITTPAK